MSLDYLRICVERLGYIEGAKVAQFCVEWGLAEQELGADMGIAEFADWWKDASTRTAYYRLERFREGFPELGEKAYPRDFVRFPRRAGRRAASSAAVRVAGS